MFIETGSNLHQTDNTKELRGSFILRRVSRGDGGIDPNCSSFVPFSKLSVALRPLVPILYAKFPKFAPFITNLKIVQPILPTYIFSAECYDLEEGILFYLT